MKPCRDTSAFKFKMDDSANNMEGRLEDTRPWEDDSGPTGKDVKETEDIGLDDQLDKHNEGWGHGRGFCFGDSLPNFYLLTNIPLGKGQQTATVFKRTKES